MKFNIFYILFLIVIFSGCDKTDKPSDNKMKECLTNELSNKAIVESYEQQDGLLSIKDGVKYYEGYFNAEIKFIANTTGSYRAGQRYKIIKGTISYMKTENGWNCQAFDISASNLVKIKEEGENNSHIASQNNVDINQQKVETDPTDFHQNGKYPEGSARLLLASDVVNLNSENLKIMRNEIFARHGYIFQTNEMRLYFENQNWYRPLYENVNNQFSNIEKTNIIFLKRFEK